MYLFQTFAAWDDSVEYSALVSRATANQLAELAARKNVHFQIVQTLHDAEDIERHLRALPDHDPVAGIVSKTESAVGGGSEPEFKVVGCVTYDPKTDTLYTGSQIDNMIEDELQQRGQN